MMAYRDNFFGGAALEELRGGHYEVIREAHEFNNEATGCRFEQDIVAPTVMEDLMQEIEDLDLIEEIKDVQDLAWRWVANRAIGAVDVSLSRFPPGKGFAWHVDHVGCMGARALNWMCTIEGEATLHYTYDFFPVDMGGRYFPAKAASYEPGPLTQVHTIRLKKNRLVLFPSYLPHRVESGDVERVSAHGHFMYDFEGTQQ